MSSNQNQDDFCHENVVIARHQNFICGVFLWSEEHGVWVWCLRKRENARSALRGKSRDGLLRISRNGRFVSRSLKNNLPHALLFSG